MTSNTVRPIPGHLPRDSTGHRTRSPHHELKAEGPVGLSVAQGWLWDQEVSGSQVVYGMCGHCTRQSVGSLLWSCLEAPGWSLASWVHHPTDPGVLPKYKTVLTVLRSYTPPHPSQSWILLNFYLSKILPSRTPKYHLWPQALTKGEKTGCFQIVFGITHKSGRSVKPGEVLSIPPRCVSEVTTFLPGPREMLEVLWKSLTPY